MTFKKLILPEFMTEYVPATYDQCFFPVVFRNYCIKSPPKYVKWFPDKKSKCVNCFFYLKPQERKMDFAKEIVKWAISTWIKK